MLATETDILVLGAGLQGTGVALELARRRIPVTLVDQDPRPLNRASLRNEGKIHLGFIYANDRSLGTAFLQLEGALRFRGIVESWLPRSPDSPRPGPGGTAGCPAPCRNRPMMASSREAAVTGLAR